MTLNEFSLSNVLARQIDGLVRVFWHRSHLTTAALKSSDFAASHRVLNSKQILVKRVYAGELLFDVDTGCWKEEVQDEYEASGCDLLIIDCVEISPKFRGTGICPIAIDKTIDIFGSVCGLAACKPWPLQFTPAFTRDRKALNRLKAPSGGQDEAVRKLRAYWSKLGFWPLGETGIYLIGIAQRGPGVSRKDRETVAEPGPGLAGRRVC